VGLWFLAEAEGDPFPGDDLDNIGFFTYEDLESADMVLAFPTDGLVLKSLKDKNLID